MTDELDLRPNQSFYIGEIKEDGNIRSNACGCCAVDFDRKDPESWAHEWDKDEYMSFDDVIVYKQKLLVQLERANKILGVE